MIFEIPYQWLANQLNIGEWWSQANSTGRSVLKSRLIGHAGQGKSFPAGIAGREAAVSEKARTGAVL